MDILPRLKRWGRIATIQSLRASTLVAPPANRLLLGKILGIRVYSVKEYDLLGATTTAFPNGARGAFCFTVDFDRSKKHPWKDRFFSEAVARTLELGKLYDVPVTWAVCGADALKEMNSYGQILQASGRDEIAFHTFDHVDLSDHASSPSVVQRQYELWLEKLCIRNHPFSVAFPWNRVGNLTTLKSLGFLAFRGNAKRTLSPPLKKQGLWDIHKSYELHEGTLAEAVFPCILTRLASDSGTVLHVWTHPWAMSSEKGVEDYFSLVVEPLFQTVSLLRSTGQIWAASMKDIALYSEARSRTVIQGEEIGDHSIHFNSWLEGDESHRAFLPRLTFKVKFPRRARRYMVSVDGHTEALGSSSQATYQRVFFTSLLSEKSREFEVRFD